MLFLINKKVITAGSIFRQFIRKIRISTFFLLIFGMSCFSQETDFWLQISSAKDQELWDLVVQPDGYLYAIGTQADTTIDFDKDTESFIFKINTTGQITDSAVFSIPDRRLSLRLIKIDGQDSLLILGFSTDTSENNFNTRLELYRINNQFQIIDHASCLIAEDRNPFWVYVDKYNPETYVIAGATFSALPGPFLRAFYLKVSAGLDSLLFWEYPELNRANLTSIIKQLNDSTIWACESNVYGENINLMDTLFNHLDFMKIPDRISDNFGIKWVNDKSFYLLGEWSGDSPEDDVGIIRMFDPIDTTGHLFTSWGTVDTFDFPAVTNGLDFRNIDSIFAGGTTNLSLGNWGYSYFFLTQYDSMLNLRWERFYGGDGYYQLYKVVATDDGGCIMAGTRNEGNYTWLERDPVIIKVNNEGYIISTPETPVLQAREAIVYPNPGNDILNIRLARQHPKARFFIFDAAGRSVLSQQLDGPINQIDTRSLPAGSYFYKITSSKGLNESGVWIRK